MIDIGDRGREGGRKERRSASDLQNEDPPYVWWELVCICSALALQLLYTTKIQLIHVIQLIDLIQKQQIQ